MLQIISGKFFEKDKKINSKVEFDVLYSNFYSPVSIKTKYFKLHPISSYPQKINQYVIEFENKYQPRDDEDILVLASKDPIIHQIKYLLTFYYNCFFHKEKNVVINFTSNNTNPNIKENISRIHLPHIFDFKETEKAVDIDGFVDFIETIISLNRLSYKLIMKYLSAYYYSIESFETNYEISYTTLIYILEALISDMNEYKPIWDDFDQSKRKKLDKIFDNIDDNLTNEIKDILIKDSNLKLKKNFTNGLYEFTKDDFYLNNNEKRIVLKSEMLHILENLYKTRSRYVHKLDSLEMIVHSHGFDKANYVYDFENPKFTIYGLSKYTKHIINNFIENPIKRDIENYLWRDDLPGIVKVKLAPQYWIASHQNFQKEYSYSKFNGFFELVSSNKFIDIREFLKKIEKNFNNVNSDEFASLFSIYTVYNFSVNEESRLINFKNVIAKHQSKIDKCRIQYLVMSIFITGTPKWEPSEQEKCLRTYYKKKFRDKSIKLTKDFEIYLICKIANEYLNDGNINKYLELLNWAIFESVNLKEKNNYLKSIQEENEIDLSKVKFTI